MTAFGGVPVSGEATIERVVPGGEGLARVDGRVTLVAGALPGDRVRFVARPDGPRLLRAVSTEILSPGPHRREASEICPRAADRTCGGCDWPSAKLESHAELKTALVLDALRRVGSLPAGALPPVRFRPSGRHYRLRNRLHLDGLSRLGFFAPASHDVTDLTTCEIVSPALLERLALLRAALEGLGPLTGELLTLESRDGRVALAELRTDASVTPAPILAALRESFDGARVVAPGGVAADGPAALVLEAGGWSFRVSVSSFFQGNRFLLDAFLEEARAAIAEAAPSGSVLDLYAGAGFLTRPLLEAGVDATAVEIEPSSFADLEANLAAWRGGGAASARAVAASAEAFLSRETRRPALVVADPPRDGMSPAVRRHLKRLAPPWLLLVSCDPATFARDVAALAEYEVLSLVLLDLFPQTHHVETLSLLRRRAGR